MRTLNNKIARAFFALTACMAMAFGFLACSNDSEPPVVIVVPDNQTKNGGTKTDGGQTPAPVPATIYTITFNANDGSPNPTTVPQNFTAGIPQALTPVEELGFSKEGFNFAGWGTAPKSTQASYADGASYTATAPATLYALWSEIPVYSVNIPVHPNGSVTATPATGIAGTEITLLAAPNAGYEFGAFTVVDADNNTISVTDGKFTMPEKNVTVTASFSAINYAVNVGTFSNGIVTASPAPATVGTSVALTASPESGYELTSLAVTAEDGTTVPVSGTGNIRAFVMPAQNVTVSATFSAIKYSVKVGTFENGSVEASPATATAGTSVTLTISPAPGYKIYVLYAFNEGGPMLPLSGTGDSRTFTMPAKNVTVTAYFTEMNYKITFNANDGSESPRQGTQYFYGIKPQTLRTVRELGFKKEGFYFAGWLTSADAENSSYVDGANYIATDSVTLYAKWSDVPVYNVNIPLNESGNIVASSATAAAGTEVTLSVVQNEGFELSSYAVIDDYGIPVTVTDGKFIMPAKNVTVTAAFNAISYAVNVGNFSNGTVTASPATATVGTIVTLTISPAPGFELGDLRVGGVDVSGTGNIRTFVMPAKNVDVSGFFGHIKYTITYNANDGSQNPATATKSFLAECPTSLTGVRSLGFKKEGFNFAGWLTSPDAEDVVYADGAKYTATSDATLYAKWTPIPVYIYASEHGEVTASSVNATVGTSVTLTASPAWNYELATLTVIDADGASVSVSGTDDSRTFTMPAKNVFVTATFREKKYAVDCGTFANGSVTASPATATFRTKVTLTASPASGYELAWMDLTDADGGWVGVSGTGDSRTFTMPAKNVSVTAGFRAINYTVSCGTFDNGSVEASAATAIVGTPVTLTISPMSGYRLGTLSVTDADGSPVELSGSGNTRTFTMPAKNVTVAAIFNAVYTVNVGTFANGSVTASPTSAVAGTRVTLTASPSYNNYRLASLTVTDAGGASVSVSGTGNSRTFTMPANNVTVSAEFSLIKYAVSCGTFANGSVVASPATAAARTSVTLTISPASGYKLASLTVTDAGGTSVSVSGTNNSRTFTMPAKNVTVSATFVEIAASGAYKKIGTKKINGVDYDIVTFGLWPQTIKAANVEIDESKTKKVGDFTYCMGSDYEWYVEIREDAYSETYKYSDGSYANKNSSYYDHQYYKWFKVEPIKWRVITSGPARKFLLAENILDTKCIYKSDNFGTFNLNLWLDSNTEGFLITAFTATEQKKIMNAAIDVSESSTKPAKGSWEGSIEPWGWVNNSQDYSTANSYVFRLSVKEATMKEYGFGACKANDNNRIRYATDFAKARGLEVNSSDAGEWWLGSPCPSEIKKYCTYYIDSDGYALPDNYFGNATKAVGVVPALCVGN